VDIKLEVFDAESVLLESGLLEKYHREEMKHIYFEEKVTLAEEDLLRISEFEVLQTELKAKLEDVIPYGFVCEDFIYHYTNSNFETKNSYRLRKSKKLNVAKVDYMVNSNEQTNNFIRDFTVNQEIFLTVAIITQTHLPQ
jgi:hypothetical protein